ncbi:hypothetical protein BDV26DRAFT_258222 [Aspergillus bertholletiae]|uniref:Uncharacterized protein n=1 Tax=Aspergillus bertholletiae TaxID=1226010 RepID=A0A5N7BE58_9EURO|nr:hypothetical protein BDV26DRAFT_258222 [Aspergillus bertholletiae]
MSPAQQAITAPASPYLQVATPPESLLSCRPCGTETRTRRGLGLVFAQDGLQRLRTISQIIQLRKYLQPGDRRRLRRDANLYKK